jgi:hypothetical protein
MLKPSRIVFLALTFLVPACSSGAPPAGSIPTVEEARGLLDRTVERAQAGDFEGLCAMGDGNCMRHLEDAGRDAVPPGPPTIVKTGTVPTTSSGGQTSLGGIVFVLCGIDGHGDHYDSEMLVFHDGNGLRAINPIYWGRTRIAGSPATEETFAPVTC